MASRNCRSLTALDGERRPAAAVTRRARERSHYVVTPEWVLYHLIEHEAHHRGQIQELLRILRRTSA